MKTRRRETKLLGCMDAGFLAIFLSFSVVTSNPVVYYVEVEENAPVGSVVLLFARGCNESSSVRLGGTLLGENATDFSIIFSAKTGFIMKTAKSLDRELKSMYELDALLPGCALNEVAIIIEVLDKNDNPPQFITTNERIEIDELTAVGSELLRLSAQDKDAGRNGEITFTMSPNPNIHVVPKTGQVLLVRSVRAPSELIVPVYARDHGDVVLQSEPLQLHIVVTAKEHRGRSRRAVSGELSYTVKLSEYAEAGDVIFTVQDQKFEEKRFELLSPESGSSVRVERETGRVYLTHKLTVSIQVVVKILNARGDEWYLCRLSVTLPGMSDLQWAMFPEPYLTTVEPGAAPGSVVYKLVARHRDGSSEVAQFLLVDGGEDCFEVDRNLGDVRTTGRPLSPGKEYTLTVQAVDTQGRKGPHASVAIMVGLRPPQFFNTSYSIYIPESTGVGHAVAVIQAVSFQRKTLSYMLLVNSGNLFSINQESGALSLTHTMDYESGPHLHHLQVRTSEPDTGLSNVAEVVVHITDENDCTPEFMHSIYSRDNIPETTPPGTSLLQVLARDCDTGLNAEISYFIQSQDFAISSQGVVSPSRKLDYERPNHMYECVVVAVDKGAPSRTGTASIRIRMANVNDEAPVFTQTVYKTFLSEDAGPETLVAIVHAKDPDGDGVTYAITGGNEDSNFELDNQKGIIRLRRSPPPKLHGLQYVLNVTATDDNAAGGPLPLSSSAQVIVGINDINNNKPVFEECHNYSLNALVLENQPPGTVVLRVQAHDADTGVNGEVKYGIMQRDGASPGFIINPDTGVISTAVSFDRERQREYTLSVTAIDQAEEPLIGICQITILIGDQNDNNPKFENSRYQYFLREDTPVGTSFLRAAAHDDDQGTNAIIAYSLTHQTPAYFRINPGTGWVYVNHPISQTSRISQQIIATDGGNLSSTVDLTVIITNMHNQPPQWEQEEYLVTIPENTVRDTKIVTIKATSPLGDPRVTYNLEEGQVPETNMPVRFYIKPNRRDSSASILVAEPLDYETTRSFTLRVRVQNVAAVPLASFTTVYVNITDVNDNVPFFMSSTYEATVPEGAEIGTSVAQVSASDLDSGLHGMVNYIILKDQSGDSQFFSINPYTGIIHTRATFDREQKSSYLIEVQSQDSSESARPGQQGQPNSDTAYVRIFVTDVNDNAPAFSQPVYEISVEEDKEVGYVVITVTANDEDEGANAKLRYQITSGNTMGTFDVEPEIGTIFIAQRLDYERVQRYHLRLVASDGKWENQTVVVINIINQNDEAPIFSQTEYHTSVMEELIELPVPVLEVSATDPDQEADQSAVRYSLHGQGAGSEFTIEELTGRIYAQKRLDREERSAWRFLVLATDENGDGLTGFADVLVEVRDINDNAPQFLCASEGCFVGHVPENSPADTSIMEMQATDLDDPKTGKNAVLTYRIVQNVRNEINLNLFSINPATGTIYTVLRSLDREVEDHYLVVVEARDGGGLSGTGTATIIVSDVNDHPPLFTQRVYMATMAEDLDINSEVLAVAATDGDEVENSVMTFSIIGGDEDRKFFIETDKGNRQGVVRLKKKIDFEKPHERTFNLTVKVEDADFYSLAYCVIQVEDSNDHAPVFFPQFYDAGSMFEDVPLGTIVAQVTAMDLDSGQNGKFTYSIAPESDPFQQFLVDKSGWVVVADSLDREKVSQHRLIIFATDMGNPSLTGSAIVLVAVQDVNDNGPEFEVPYRPIVWENTIAPQLVHMNDTSTLLHAIDRDSSPNAGPFSIRLLMITSDATNFNLTDLRNGSAMITALRTFDREQQKEYLLPILMADSGSPPMSSTSTLTIIIGDKNDHPHAPGHSEFIVYNYEGTLPTTILGQVQSPDIDDWSEKVYKFEDRPSRQFILNQNSGQLSIKSGTPAGTYRLQVRVADKSWPDVTSTVQITVRELKEEALLNAGSLRFSNVTAEQFFRVSDGDKSLYERLQCLLSEVFQTDLDKVHIFSLANGSHSTQQHLSLWFAAHGSPYYKPEKLHGNMAMHKIKLESALGVSILQVGVDECDYADCSPAGGCSSRVTFSDTPSVLNGGNTSLVSVSATVRALCGCLARESKHMSCSSYPHSPCLNGGTCVDTEMGYSCQCPPLFDGPECQQTRHTFLGDGYAWFPPIKPCFKSHISLEFITESTDGLLLYNGPLGVHHPGDKGDFIALELKKGIPVLSVNHGSGTVTLQLLAHASLSDRRWHHLDIISDGKEVYLIVDHCSGAMVNEVDGLGVDMFDTDQSVCKVSAHTPGNERFLNLNQPLQLGGVKDTYPLRHTNTHYKGFVGCIRNLVVDTQVYDLSSAAESMNSAPGCSLTDGVCMTMGGPSCGLRGKCLGEWGSFSCDCHPGYSGHKCDNALPEWSFEKESMLRYQLRTGISPRRTHAQFLIRTRSSSGFLLSMSSRDSNEFIILEIVDGYVCVRANLGDGPNTLKLGSQRVDHGQWVLVILSRHDNVFTLQLEQGGGSREVTGVLGNKQEIVVQSSSVLLGNGASHSTQEDFQGCMQDVRLNGHSLPLDGQSSEFVMVLERRGVQAGCHSDACRAKPCQKPLYCVDLWRKHECRCPAGQLLVVDEHTGLVSCAMSPCGPSTCRNGGTCLAHSTKSYQCRCPEGFRGQWCEISQVKTSHLAALSPSSILAISMCLLVFFAVLVAVTVWNQKGSENKFRKRGVYHIPAEHESWEDIRENILNYNEEGGGEQDQNAYDITELKRPFCSSLSQSSSCTTAPLIKSSQGSQEEVHPGGVQTTHHHHNPSTASHCAMDFKNYVARIIWEADNDIMAYPMDTYHVYCIEGAGSNAGSLSSLSSAIPEEDFSYDSLQHWGPKFEGLKELFQRPELGFANTDVVPSLSHTGGRSFEQQL
ncbi:neural-cadherin [Tachysurus fulvidraco]|uniref:neural-cadherin n=1 Tax=Tachysurus fulvidraco TaxID=1234273 RepID=UPI001FEF4D36|nr:neural-cadherin [Tachysurus fulvidraco]